MAQDKNKAGVPVVHISKSHVMQEYQKDIAVRVLDLVAAGWTLTDVEAEPNMPTRQTLYRWLTLYKEFGHAYKEAKRLSATAFEDKALAIAKKLEDNPELTGTRITALKEAMVQYRWSAARRDPAQYGGAAPTTGVVVPIQINTTLDLAADAGGQDGYSFTARVVTPVGEEAGAAGDTPGAVNVTAEGGDPNEDVDVADVDPYNAPETVPAWNGRRGRDKAVRVDHRFGPRKPLGPRQAAKVRAQNVIKRAEAKAPKG